MNFNQKLSSFGIFTFYHHILSVHIDIFIVWRLITDQLAEQALPEDYLPTDISKLKMDEIFEHIDTDSDGRISYEEFRNALSLQDVIMTSFRAAES
jgi:hypothetical protein